MTVQRIGSLIGPFAWDKEEDLRPNPGEAHLRDRTMYLTAMLLKSMNEAWGGVTTAVKTSTDVETGDVMVFRADPKDPDGMALRFVETQNAAEFSFIRPLVKLNLGVPASRQFIISPYTRAVEGVGTVFIFPMSQRISAPRGRRSTAVPSSAEPESGFPLSSDPLAQTAAASDPEPEGEVPMQE